MKRILPAIVVIAAVVGWAPHASALTIKLATLAPKDSPWYDVIREMAERWEQASGGRIRVRIYASGVAGGECDIVRKMRVGQIHAALLTSEGLDCISPDTQALQMPMMFRSYEELDYVIDRFGPTLETSLEARGFKLLAWGDAGWARFFAQQPVVHPDDLLPQRIFIWSKNAAYIEAWKDLGYKIVPLPVTEMHTALQSGLVNAFATTPMAALSFQWFGLATHMTDLKLKPLVGAVVIAMPAWQAIPDDVKPLFLDAARSAGTDLRELRQLGEEAIEVMKKHGLVVHHVPPDVVVQWEKRIRDVSKRLVGPLAPARMVAEVERLRDEHRALPKGQ